MIFNTYGDHPVADQQILTGAAAQTFCETAFPYEELPTRDYAPSELGQRRITAYVFSDGQGSRSILWAYGLVGVQAGTALTTDQGRSFHVPNRGPRGYHDAEATIVPRSEVPVP